MAKKLTQRQFIKRSRKVHGNKYDYSEVVYVNAITKVIIKCPDHGKFLQKPGGHSSGHGCKKCADIAVGDRARDNKKDFIKKSRQVHGDKYDYSKVRYKGGSIKVTIKCPNHGEFIQSPLLHKRGHGCRKCFTNSHGNAQRMTTEQFIKQAKRIHGEKYDYRKVDYKGNYHMSRSRKIFSNSGPA